MALARSTTWTAGQVLTATALNAEFDNILNSALSLISPLTGALAAGGFDITGIDELGFNNAAANATANGQARRNGANLTYHDGTAARNIVFDTATQTLAAKTLTGPVLTSPEINNPAETFQYVFVGSALLADRNITLPLLTENDTFVFADFIQTLTNKTLTAPTLNGGTHTAVTNLAIRSTGTGAFDLTFANTENLTAGRALTLTLNNTARTVNLSGDITTAGAFITSGAFSLTLTATAATNVTLPTSGTLATLAGTETLTAKILTSPIIGTQVTLDQSTADYTLTWADPAAARAISIPDPLGTDVFVFRDMAQTLAGKTLSSPTISGTLAGSFTASGTLTLSGAGPVLQLTNTDAQILIAGSTDPGWSVGAIQVGTRSALYTASGVTTLTYNEYTDGTPKAIATAPSGRISMSDDGTTGTIVFLTDTSRTAATATSPTTRMRIIVGVQVGTPTDGDKGAGTLNANAVYDDGVLLTDHVFDTHVDTQHRPHADPDIRAWQQKFNPDWLDPQAFHAYCRTHRRLPEMPTRRNEKSIGQVLNALTMSTELLIVHQEKLLKRLEVLETP